MLRFDRAAARSRRRRALLVVAVIGSIVSLGPVAEVAAQLDEDDGMPAVGGSFRSVEPARVLDTRRSGQGPCVSGERVVEVADLPADAVAVALNVTVTGASSPGYMSVFAAGASKPSTSSLNFSAGPTVENSVVSGVGVEGIAVFASGGCPQVIVDVVGYFTGGKPARGGSFSGVEPTRLVDTRRAGQGPCVAGERIVDLPDVPAGAGGAVLNVTVTGASSPGYVSVYAAGFARPSTSSVNFVAGQTVANGVVSSVTADGLAVFASGGCPHVIVDLVGWFTGEAPVLQGSFVGGGSTRLVDTRRSDEGPCVSGERVVDVFGVPEGVTGVVLNVTATGARSPGYVSVFADGASRPSTSVLNVRPGQIVANGAITGVGPEGIRVFASGGCPHVIVDLVGWYSGEPEPLTDVVQVAVGTGHTCAVISDGAVRCWGADLGLLWFPGQLGDGRGESSAFPVPVTGIDDAVQVGTGPFTSCAVHEDRTVSCWGLDVGDELSETSTLEPVPVPGLSDAMQVEVGQFMGCALVEGGTVSCWGGSGFNGREGENRPEPAPVPELEDVVEIASGDGHTCARHSDGAVSCWGAGFGDHAPGDPIDPSDPAHQLIDGLDDAVSISSGGRTTCAVRADSSVWCWGETAHLVDGSGFWHVDPVEVPALHGPVSIGLGMTAACGLGEGGQVTCIGSGPLVPRDEGADSSVPLTIPGLEGAQQLTAGEWGACALLEDSTLRCWGGLIGFQRGDGSADFSSEPSTVIAGIRSEVT